MSLHYVQYEIYSNLKYFAESRGIELEYTSTYPNKLTKPLQCKDVIALFNVQRYLISSFKIKDNTKTYTIIYGYHKNYKVLSNDIQVMINKIPETKLVNRKYNIDINLIIRDEFIKSNIINKINSLKIKETSWVDITYHSYKPFLQGNLKESNMYVDSIKINEVEKNKILKAKGSKELTIISPSDMLAKYNGYKKGDIIMVEFPNIEMGIEVEYKQIG